MMRTAISPLFAISILRKIIAQLLAASYWLLAKSNSKIIYRKVRNGRKVLELFQSQSALSAWISGE